MTDPRNTVDPRLFTQSTRHQIAWPCVDICRSPDGARDRQLALGQEVEVLGIQDEWAYIRAHRDGYVGHIRAAALAAPQEPTHYVSAPCTHAYARADFKSPDTVALTHLSRITALSETAGYVETSHGFIPTKHLNPMTTLASDPALVATHYLGTDYLWGGNTRWGIDCSGLVQASLLACGIPCPGDSDQQMTLGAAATGAYERNDLLFWKGHVALVTAADTMIHANAHSMQVNLEHIETAIARIAASNDGPVTAHRRL